MAPPPFQGSVPEESAAADHRAAFAVQSDLGCLPAVLGDLFPEAASGERARWCRQLAEFSRHLHRWSGRMNLVADGDRSALVNKHLIPSLLIRSALGGVPHRQIVDLGSGAGLPGIPLKIVLPNNDFVLVESRRRRASFLREVVRRLALQRIAVENLRLEQWRGSPRGGVDLVTARAVADPAVLFERVRPILAPKGHLLAFLPTDRSPSDMDPPPAEVRTVGWRDIEVRLGLWKQPSGSANKK